MKLLKNMLVINWHYFSHALVPFDQVNFLTGQNAAGKSTLLDALQVVMLGETQSYIFNKAANDKSERTLIGYLKGELGDDGDTGFRYLRAGDFNAYVVLEFFDTVKKSSFMAGVLFDVYGDGTQKNSYFISDGAIPEHQFIQKGMPLNRDQFRAYLKDTAKNHHQWFDTQMAYRNHLMSRLGNIKHKFFSLFKKAVPFAPITDIEKFITEYITDIKGRPNIEEMQHNLRHYKRLEQEANLIGDRVRRLTAISDSHGNMQAKATLQSLHQLLSTLAEESMAKDTVQKLSDQLVALDGAIIDSKQQQATLASEAHRREEEQEALIHERASSDLTRKLETLEKAIEQLESERRGLLENLQKTVSEVKRAALNLLNQTVLEVTLEDQNDLSTLASLEVAGLITGESAESLVLQGALDGLDTLLKSSETTLQKLKFELDGQLFALAKSLEDWRGTLADLKRGIKDYPKDVLRLKGHLETMGIRDVVILADVLEVNAPNWLNAVEGYLHTQKFYLLCHEDDFDRALAGYDVLRETTPVYQVGLIDTAKLRGATQKVEAGSLAEVVDTVHAGARLFVDFTLGRVMRCETLQKLRSFPTAITVQGMLYQNFVARQLSPDRWKVPFIGRQSLERQIANITLLFDEATVTHKTLSQKQETLNQLHIKSFSSMELQIHGQSFGNLKGLKACAADLVALHSERNGLDLSYLDTLATKIKIIKDQLIQLRKDQEQKARELGKIESDAARLQAVDLPGAKDLCKRWGDQLRLSEFDAVKEEGNQRFSSLSSQQALGDIAINYARSAKAARSEKENTHKTLTSLREDYNRVYHMSHDVSMTDNGVYDGVLNELSQTRLPEYVGKIKEAQDKATIQFRDEFLSKLKENFDAVAMQIKELNAAIKDSPFGTDNYRFEVKPKTDMRHFYDMIMDELLMGEGMSILSHAFNAKHQDAIDELFRMIVGTEGDVDSSRRSMLEKQITYYTDYRSYLQFDLVVKDQNGNEQRLSKTLLKKSGGETQTPFYLAVLASFAHMYRVNQKGVGSETLRLIVFDEAFSKMDQQRIAESLKLLRKFKLQAIISAPPDKIMDIAPHVDKNLCVFRHDDISFVQSFNKRQIEEMAE